MQEFAGRHNLRGQDTIRMMRSMRDGMDGKRLTYKALTAPNGLPSGARAQLRQGIDMKRKQSEPPTVRLVHHSYQPSKAELEQDHRVDATFQEIAKAVTRTVKVEFHKPPKRQR